jgi:hypothetical protein
MKKLTLVLLLLLTTNSFAYETGDTYVGVQYGASIDGIDDIENTYGLLRLGVYVTPAITLELRYGDGIDDDTIMGVDYSIDRIAGLYALYHLELSSAFSIYGLVGYSEADLKAEASGGSVIEKEDDISYGIGLDLGNINFEYTHVLEDSNYEVNAASIGYTYHFE